MSHSSDSTRPDPLLDAYRQASAHEGARPGAQVRAAVLAHARVVAQAMPLARVNVAGISDATRATPAANEHKPIWRLVAGVVIGLVGVWIFQLTRPAANPDTAVAVANAPQTEKARVAEPAAAAAPATAATPTAPVTAQVAARESAVASATVAAAPPAPISAGKAAVVARDRRADAALPEQNLAMAKIVVPKDKAERPAASAGAAIAAAPPPALATDSAAGGLGNEVVIASVQTRKSARAETRAEPAMTTPSAAPNAFPAPAAEPMIASAPAPAQASRPASVAAAAPAPMGASGTMAARGSLAQSDAAARPQSPAQTGDTASPIRLSESDLAMFKAVRAGDVPGLRAAIARGASVNIKDERGRSTLQIARERVDAEMVRALDAAGAR